MAAKKTQNARGSAAAKKASTSAGTKKAAASKTSAKKASGTKAAAKTSSTKSAAAKAATKSSAKKAATSPAKKSATPAKKSARTTKSSPAKKSTSKKAAALRVRADESPWTPSELSAVREDLLGEQQRLTVELEGIESDIQQLMRDSGEGSGDDDADAGVKTSEREQEFTVARNSTAILEQGERALQAIEDGSYGVCESCGKPIGKLRMQAQPRATLCVTCKQEQERH